jgi:hypothetical protein
MGIVSFLPTEQISIVNSLNGEFLSFTPFHHTWKMDVSYHIPRGLIPELNQQLNMIFDYFALLKKGLSPIPKK